MFLDILRHNPETHAFVDSDGNKMTYGELAAFAAEFKAAIGKRTLIAVLCRNLSGCAAGIYSSVEAKAVPLLIGAKTDVAFQKRLFSVYRPEFVWSREEDIKSLVAENNPTEAKSLVAENNHSDAVTMALKGTESVFVAEKVMRGGSGFFSCCGYYLYEIKANSVRDGELYDDLSLLLSTSGSTGSPKLVRHSYENLSFSAEAVSQALDLSCAERPMASLPLQYTMGLSVVTSHLYAGATVLLCEEGLMKPAFWSLLKDERATSFTGVPYNFEILRKLRIFRMELPFLKRFYQGGGKMSPEIMKEFLDFCEASGKKMYFTYGTSEGTARMAALPPELAVSKAGSIGRAIPGGRLLLAEDGEMIYEGKNVTLGYAECREDLRKGDERHGRLMTGDIAHVDKDGCFYIDGRKTRFLKLFGLRVSLDETERFLSEEYPFEFACTGSDERLEIFYSDNSSVKSSLGSSLKSSLGPSLKSSLKSAEIQTFASGKLGIPANTVAVFETDVIPRNEAGKIQYSLLRCSDKNTR